MEHSGLTQEAEELTVVSKTQTDSQDNYEEIERIHEQRLQGSSTHDITVDKIKEWHAYVMTAVKQSRKEEIDNSFQKFINNEGELIEMFMIR